MSFLKGFMSVFDWMFVENKNPQERVDEILDDFYFDHPEIERDDNKALEKDFLRIYNPYSHLKIYDPDN